MIHEFDPQPLPVPAPYSMDITVRIEHTIGSFGQDYAVKDLRITSLPRFTSWLNEFIDSQIFSYPYENYLRYHINIVINQDIKDTGRFITFSVLENFLRFFTPIQFFYVTFVDIATGAKHTIKPINPDHLYDYLRQTPAGLLDGISVLGFHILLSSNTELPAFITDNF